MTKLANKVAIVSGSGRGIGREIALKLAAGGRAVACAGSVTEPDFGTRFVGTALKEFGRLDIIVNNAGYTWDNVIQKMSDEQWNAIMDVHLGAPFSILRAAADYFKEASRSEATAGEEVFRKVMNISSVSGVMGNAGQANYAAAKAGINGLTKALAKEWGRYKVTVNSVAFGLIHLEHLQVFGDPGGLGCAHALLAPVACTVPDGDLRGHAQQQHLERHHVTVPWGRARIARRLAKGSSSLDPFAALSVRWRRGHRARRGTAPAPGGRGAPAWRPG